MNKIWTGALAIVAGVMLAAPVTAAPGDILFSSDLDSGAGLTVLGTADTASTFGYDYSADDIPSAPGGTGTTGLKLEANISTGTGSSIAVVTSAPIVAPAYTLTVDAWINANGPFPGGGSGSTEFIGASVVHDLVTPDVNGVSLIYTGEGGSSLDWRVLSDGTIVESYNAPEEPVFSAFPGVAPPAGQSQTGVPQDGVGGFQWMTITAFVNTLAGTADVSITSEASGNTVTFDTVALPTISGSAGVIYADFFTSVSGDPTLSFGAFDNLQVVESRVPEPTSLALLGMGTFGLLVRRRRS